MYIADMHCDSLLTVSEEHGLLSEYNTSKKYPQLQLFAAFVPFRGRSAEHRRHELLRLLNVYIYETDRLGISRIDGVRGLCSAIDMNENASVFAVEGGGGLFADSEELFTLHKAGLRVMSLAWDTNELASASSDSDDSGLSYEGRRMAKRLAELGITVDVSHLSDRSFWNLCDAYPLPLIATHSNFREICDNKRNLTLDMAKEISARGGVIGLNLYPDFVKADTADISDIFRHIDYALEHLGTECLGFGFDIDGTGHRYPLGINEECSIHDKVIELLLGHYPEALVRKLAGENVTNFFKGVL